MPSVEEHLGAVGHLVRTRRRHALLSQADLAARAHVEPTVVARLETGRAVALMSLVAVLSALEIANPIDPAAREAHAVLMSRVPRQGATSLGAIQEAGPAGL